MRKNLFVLMFILVNGVVIAQSETANGAFNGDSLFADVKKFTSFGIHRTGTTGDNATSEWLEKELKSYGFNVHYLEFPVKKFLLESSSVLAGENKIDAFPLWYVNDKISLVTGGVLEDGALSGKDNLKDKIAFVRFKGSDHIDDKNRLQLKELVGIGVSGIVIITENFSGEIMAANTSEDQTPWAVPIVIIAPKDSARLLTYAGKEITVSIKGTFKQGNARNVYGTIGNGKNYVVISTPISGWFTCGGERGPGIAVWLALAKWAASAKLPYTFIFTGNSGHELFGLGAHAFLDKLAPPVEQTTLWVHLGAAIATLSWKQTATGLQQQNTVDTTRTIVYTPSVSAVFTDAFNDIKANKREVNGQPVGELVYVAQHGYKNYVGAANGGQAYFHTPVDNAAMTLAPILEEIALAFKNFIELDLKNASNNK